MDPEAFLDLANQVVKLKMFPYFDIAHSVLCALHVREDLGPGKKICLDVISCPLGSCKMWCQVLSFQTIV
jgi:hypothetical protein